MPPPDIRGREELFMRASMVAGIVLIVLGVVVFAYGGFSYTKPEKVIDFGPIEATAKTREHVPLPPILGGAAILGGIALLVAGGRRR